MKEENSGGKSTVRVLQVNLENSGGAFSLMYQVQERLLNQVAFDWFCMGVFKRNGQYEQLRERGSQIYEQNLRKNRLIGHLLLPFRFGNFLRKNHYEVIHVHSDAAWKLLLYTIPARICSKDTRVILHSHCSGINGDYKLIKKFCHLIFREILHLCKAERLACSTEARLWMFPKDSQVTTVKNGVDISKFEFHAEKREQIRMDIGVSDEQIVLAVVGDMSYQKYPQYMLDFLEASMPVDDRFIVLFIGDGESRIEVEREAHERNLEKNVIFYGRTDCVGDVLCGADIFVMPSRFEGLPVSAVEAQVSGLYTLLSDKITKEAQVTEWCDFFSINESAEVLMDKINKLNANGIKIDRENVANRLHGSEWDIRNTAQSLKEIYERA